MTIAASRTRPAAVIPALALGMGVAAIVCWLVPGIAGMIAVGILGSLAVSTGTWGILVAHGDTNRASSRVATIAIALGLIGLAGLWITAVLVQAIPA
jgi:hypothetical protein